MPKATKLPSGSWRVQASKMIDGKLVRRSFTDKSRQAALSAAAVWQAEREFELTDNTITLRQAIKRYINERKGITSPTTIATYEKFERLYFKDLMDRRVCEISDKMIQAEITLMSKDEPNKKALAPKTVKSAVSFLISVIKSVFPRRIISVKFPQKQKRLRTELKFADIQEIIKAVKGTDVELPTLMGLWLGMRKSEIRAVTFADLKGDKLKIDKALVDVDGKAVLKSTKTTGSTRTISVPKYIKDLIKAQPHESKDERIVKLTGAQIYKHFIKALSAAGITDYTFHDLRHINASVMLSLNIPDKYAMSRGGWSTDHTMKQVYQELFDAAQASSDKKINDFFESKMQLTSHEIAHAQ